MSVLPVDVSNNATVKILDSNFILKHCLVLIPQKQSVYLNHTSEIANIFQFSRGFNISVSLTVQVSNSKLKFNFKIHSVKSAFLSIAW